MRTLRFMAARRGVWALIEDEPIPNTQGSALDLNNYVPFFVRATANKIARAASNSYNALFGVGLGEWSCLALLAMEGDVSASRIAETSGFDKAAVSRSIASLEKKGLVVTTAVKEHNRKKLIRLTPEGAEIYAKIAKMALDREKSLLNGLSAAERALLIRLLRILNSNAARILADLDLAADR